MRGAGFRVQGSGFREGEGSSRWAPVLVAVLALVAMGRLVGAEFTWWDDPTTVHQNPHLNPPTWESAGHYWTHEHMGLYVPVTYTVWAGLAAIGSVGSADPYGIRLNPAVFHGANVLVHAGNALIVYAILRRVVRREGAAGVGAMVFAVHPVQVETVGWVSGMKDLLCGLFVLGAVWNYMVYAEGRRGITGGSPVPRALMVHYWGAVVLTVLGTLSKPTAVVAPVLMVGVDLWVVGRGWREVARSVWPVVVTVVPCGVWTKLVQDVEARGPSWSRPLVALDAVAFYLGKVVWPGGMGIDYGRNPRYVIETAAVWWTWAVPVAGAAVLWWRRRAWGPLVGAGWVFVAGMLPVLGLTPFMFQEYSTVADHYLYLPMLGVGMGVAWIISRWPGRVSGVLAGVVIATLVVRSVVQAGAWADEEALDRNGIAVNPRSYMMRSNLATWLDMRARREGSAELAAEALAQARAAVEIKPDSPKLMEKLAEMLIRRGELDEGIVWLRRAVEESAKQVRGERDQIVASHRMLGAVLAQRGRFVEAAEEYRKALAIEPGNREVERELEEVEKRGQPR